MPEIYLDHAAAAPIDPRVITEMKKAAGLYGNPSSFNNKGREAREALDSARLTVARFLNARSEEIIFTASGSEANNLTINGVYQAYGQQGSVMVSAIEHLSVLEPARSLWGDKVITIPVDGDGIVNPEDVKRLIRSDTILVSVMYANNEIGTIEPAAKIGKIIREYREAFKIKNSKLKIQSLPLFHVDACQAAGYLPMDVHALGADLLTFNGSKIYGPRGIGVLYVRRNISLAPLIRGGGQEKGLRAGTENLSAIMGLAKAISLIKKWEGDSAAKLRDYFIDGILKAVPEAKLNGPKGDKRLPNNINISIPNLESGQLLLELDKYKIYAGSGSACTSRVVEPSHVLKAIGVKKPYLDSALRFSLGRQTTKKEIDYVLKVLPKIVKDLKQRYGLKK